MNLSEVSIRRPILATVLSLVIVLFGVLGLKNLGIREYPAVDPPVVTVSTSYGGANPEIIDAQITEPVEQAISAVAGIRNISSTSREGRSEVRVEFQLGEDLEAAANDVRDKVSQVVRRLPADADPPVVNKADANSDPIIFLALQSDTRNILEVSDFADRVIKERMQTIPGVSDVRIFGEKRYAMRLWLDPDKMVAHGVTPQDVFDAVNRENVDLPAGRIEGLSTELSIRTEGRLATDDEFDGLVIREDGGRQILLRDVGYAELGAESLRSGNRSKGLPMIGVAVIPQPNTNAIEIADEFMRRLQQIRRELPPDFEMEIGYDFTRFVRKSIVEVEETLLVAFSLVTLIIFLFLREWRAVVIPVVAIPISIVSGFFIMYVAGFSINVLTLVALVLAIGLVCDDAIVVLENIYAKVEEGMTPFRAAAEGSREIYFAVISTTIALAAVFIPVIFLQGLTGRLFREFGVVVMGTVLVSAFVALTLSPAMSRLLLKHRDRKPLFYRMTEPFFVVLNAAYRWTLRVFMKMRFVAIPILGAIIASGIWFRSQLRSELAPMEDRSNIRLSVRAPEGASFDYTSERMADFGAMVEDKYGADVHRVFAIGGTGGQPNSGVFSIYLKEPDARERSAFEVLADLSEDASQYRGLRGIPSMPPTIGDRRSTQPVQFVLQAPSLDAMLETLPRFMDEAAKQPDLRFVDADLKTNSPQARIEIDRARAAEFGVSVQDIARTLQLAFGETRYGYFLRNGRQYQILGQLARPDRDEPADLDRLHVRGRNDILVPMSSIVRVAETVAPSAIYRYDRYISATVSAGLAPGATLGDGIAAMRAAAETTLPDTFTTSLAGQARDFEDSSNSLAYAFVLAVTLIFLVLAAQFESWVDPFVIMLTVPMSVAGALFSLWYMDQTLNIFSQIGIIMLVGLVTKNGILIVEFANQRKDAGSSVVEAATEAAASRFRPILMTSLSTILGILPIAMAIGGAAGSRRSLGIAVVGGMAIATALTLYVVPAVYAMLSTHKRREHEGEEPAGKGHVPAKVEPEVPATRGEGDEMPPAAARGATA